MCPLFLNEQGSILANVTSSNGKYTDLYQYSLTGSEGILFQSICSAHDLDHFYSIPNSLAKLTTSD